MKTQRYQLRISGLKEEEGQIRMATLRRIMDAIHATAESATRLLATGAGKGKGARPQWLDATIDFTITGLKPGSTIFEIEAPRLGETAYEQFFQEDLWNTRPSLDETALDLVAQSINEIQTDDPVGDYFDSAVLQAILKFGKAAGVRDVRYEMTPLGTAQGRFMLDKRIYVNLIGNRSAPLAGWGRGAEWLRADINEWGSGLKAAARALAAETRQPDRPS